ncbi:YjbQ family protein [Haladaptatus sp. F3-133]|uniref:YjbQ family protein n=1 Tax=Halorutilus salinus TaxID=2487751 RepID=A0A9Q4GH18_9EURY|nr:YjbQ family protein [Halorutilus salinus]MCX2819724.1 YjbQ family protein [Halorutilus salinus]
MRSFEVETDSRTQVAGITDRVRSAVPDDATGVCTVFVRHTTAGVVVQENEDRLVDDIEDFLRDLVPDEGHAHDALDENVRQTRSDEPSGADGSGNADSHLRATVIGSDVSIPVEDGELALGTWQSVLFVECDGSRTREVTVACTPS